MWQQVLERFVPLVDEDLSSLDGRDGVVRSQPGDDSARIWVDGRSVTSSTPVPANR
jgi:hypothetical protein